MLKPIKEIRSIDGVQDFGYFYVCIKPLIKDFEHKSRHYIEKQTGLDHKTVQKLIDGTHIRTEHKVIERICYCFNCNIKDFCVYIPPKND